MYVFHLAIMFKVPEADCMISGVREVRLFFVPVLEFYFASRWNFIRLLSHCTIFWLSFFHEFEISLLKSFLCVCFPFHHVMQKSLLSDTREINI